ncbi:iron-containing alcohol dehydrogenase [Humibacter sp. BT305]|nr:iron-containing alcohol dehydrogenase [Humibacter sp. BT305]
MTTASLAELSLASSRGAMRVLSGEGAVRGIAAFVDELAPTGEIVLLTDSAAKVVDTVDLLELVRALLPEGRSSRTVEALESDHGVTLDEATVARASADAAGAAVVIAVGSGTVSDLGKVVAAAVAAPLISVQTAASVNGFADPLSVLVQNGAKRTVPSMWPAALVIDSDVVAEAPVELTRAGVGDAVAIWSAPADWYLACAIGMDPGEYDDRFVDPVREIAPRLADASATEAERLAALVEVLTVGGLVIGDAGTTAPLSGVEHLVSHVLDMSAMAAHARHDLHGAQVGVASILAASLWDVALHEEHLLDLGPDDLSAPTGLRERVLETWSPVDPSGALGEECWRAVEKKMDRWASVGDRVEAFFAGREGHLAALEQLAGDPAHPAAALRLWGAPLTFSELTPAVSAERARWALGALPFMRDRLSLADVFVLAGRWDDRLFDRVFARAAEVGGGL